MGLQWSAKIIKYLLFIFNLLFVLSGIIIISVGATIKAKYSSYETFLDNSCFSIPNLLIATGSIIFFIAFFGCCGAVKENYCMTITFSTLLILIFILELAAGISGYVLKDSTASFLEEKLQESLDKYQLNPKPNDVRVITKTWDLVQRGFNCCGVHSYKDWETAQSTEQGIPISCCDVEYGMVSKLTCDDTPENQSILHTKGCVDAFGDYVRDHAYTLGSVGITFAIIQFLAIIFSCKLASQLKYYDNF